MSSKKLIWFAIGTAVVGIGSIIAYRIYSKKKIAEYYVNPLYKLPQGVVEAGKDVVNKWQIEAVKVKYNDFVLHEVYVPRDDTLSDTIYLVEHYEGHDPLVFDVTKKEIKA